MGYVESDTSFDGSGGMPCILSSSNPLSRHTLAWSPVAVYTGVESPDPIFLDMEEKSLDACAYRSIDNQYSLFDLRFSLAH